MSNSSSVEKGSQTTKGGFSTENEVIDIFNSWEQSDLAKDWLKAMNYSISEIENVTAKKIPGSFKADVQVQVSIKLKGLIDTQNIQVKLVSNSKRYNQVDKRWLERYKEMWDIPENVFTLLKYYTGELAPYKEGTKDKRRMFVTEFAPHEQKILIDWITKNKFLIISDILKGRGFFAAEWVLVIQKEKGKITKWVLKPINFVMNYYSHGDISITSSGNIHIGKITMQRKGGDAGRPTANMLQFKLDPTELLKP